MHAMYTYYPKLCNGVLLGITTYNFCDNFTNSLLIFYFTDSLYTLVAVVVAVVMAVVVAVAVQAVVVAEVAVA